MYFKKVQDSTIIRKRYDNNEEEINHNNSWNDALCRTAGRLWKQEYKQG